MGGRRTEMKKTKDEKKLKIKREVESEIRKGEIKPESWQASRACTWLWYSCRQSRREPSEETPFEVKLNINIDKQRNKQEI